MGVIGAQLQPCLLRVVAAGGDQTLGEVRGDLEDSEVLALGQSLISLLLGGLLPVEAALALGCDLIDELITGVQGLAIGVRLLGAGVLVDHGRLELVEVVGRRPVRGQVETTVDRGDDGDDDHRQARDRVPLES